MLNVIFLEKALDDLSAIKNFISLDSFEQWNIVKNHIENTAEMLWSFPEMWREISSWIRVLIDSKYKFRIFYKIFNKNILIISISKSRKDFI